MMYGETDANARFTENTILVPLIAPVIPGGAKASTSGRGRTESQRAVKVKTHLELTDPLVKGIVV